MKEWQKMTYNPVENKREREGKFLWVVEYILFIAC
jgi:hypothetical protein